MKPHQYADVSAQILKDRGTAYGDYTKLFDNIATRWNLVYADKLDETSSYRLREAR